MSSRKDGCYGNHPAICVKELRWRGYDARYENGRIIVKLRYPDYPSFCKARRVLKECIGHIGCLIAWEAQFIRTKEKKDDEE